MEIAPTKDRTYTEHRRHRDHNAGLVKLSRVYDMEPVRRDLPPPHPFLLSLSPFLYSFFLFDNLPSVIAQLSQP